MHQLIKYRDCLGRTIFHNFFIFDDIESLDIYLFTIQQIMRFMSMLRQAFKKFAEKVINFMDETEMKTLMQTPNRYGRLPCIHRKLFVSSWVLKLEILHWICLIFDFSHDFAFVLLLNAESKLSKLLSNYFREELRIIKELKFEIFLLENLKMFSISSPTFSNIFLPINENFLSSRMKFVNDLLASNREKNSNKCYSLTKSSTIALSTPLKIAAESSHSRGF